MNEKCIVVGDIHLQESEPKKSQALMFLDWLVNQDFNNKDNTIILAGDLCDVNSKPELLGIYVNYFLNKFNFKKIIIIQGNHDINLMSSILSVFEPISNVEVITEPTSYFLGNTSYFLGNTSFLFLPYYNHEGKNLISMEERYSNLHKEEEFNTFFNYGIGHIEDHTQHFSNKFCDTSNLDVVQWLNGHIHTETVSKSGNYLGSPILNSVTESGKTPYIAEIDVNTSEMTLIEVPKFLEFYEVTYPQDLPKIDTLLALFLVNDSITKEETLKYYQEQAKKLGYDFYARRILKKKVKTDNENSNGSNEDTVYKTDLEYFNEFSNISILDKEVDSLCREVIVGE